MKAQKYQTANTTAPNTGEMLKIFYIKRRIYKTALQLPVPTPTMLA
ncbi:MAG: hypothetical protein IPK18_13360 [Sphingobacteriales bacterium]|jgi:hypothetical protein|nr:MAG: hypothetical protein IPK18_13360 [Sphingobacteriales bacterium]